MSTFAKASTDKIKVRIKTLKPLCSLPYALCFFTIFYFLFLIFNCEANATIRYVSHTGSSTPPYTSWETAADSIQKCIDISEFGDTIYVANGIYKEQVVMINGLSLIGAGTDSCIIDTRDLIISQNSVSVKVADNCFLTGFQILVYYNSDWGYGIDGAIGNGSSFITHNKITTAFGGILTGLLTNVYKNRFENVSVGAELFNSNAVVKQNIIHIDPNSQTVIKAGVYVQAFNNNYYPIIDSNYIETIDEGIRKSFGSTPTITNNELVLKPGWGIYIGGDSDSGYIYNNKIVTETFGVSGIFNSGIPHLRVYNNFITGNFRSQSHISALRIGPSNNIKQNVITDAEKGVEAFDNTNLVFQYNSLWNNDVNYSGLTPDTTNLSVDPMVVNDDTTQGELDFHLQAYSPLIDAGDPSMIDKDSSRIDIGLYGGLYGEVYKYKDLAPRPPVNVTGILDSQKVTIKWNPNTEADFNHYNLYRDTSAGFTTDSSTLVISLTDTFYSHIIPENLDFYYYKLRAVDNQGNISETSEEVSIKITSVITGDPLIISSYLLYQNYPNPFNPTTKISYRLKEGGYVKLYVYDVKGELIKVLVNQYQEGGYYEVQFSVGDSSPDIASGVYIYQIMIRNEKDIPVFSDIKKMILIK